MERSSNPLRAAPPLLRRLKESGTPQQYYRRWGDLTEDERTQAFRIEAALDRLSSVRA